MKIQLHSKKSEVMSFLGELKDILLSEKFDYYRNLVIIRSGREEVRYSTTYTLIDLEYDESDIVECLKKLTIQDYSETLVDRDDKNPPFLFVFGKVINHRTVYIKLKIKGEQNKKILCLSFHYAKHEMDYPYAK